EVAIISELINAYSFFRVNFLASLYEKKTKTKLINAAGRRNAQIFFIPKIAAENAVSQVGNGGLLYLGSPFMVVSSQFPSCNISRAVIKLRASCMFIGNEFKFTKKIAKQVSSRSSKWFFSNFMALLFS